MSTYTSSPDGPVIPILCLFWVRQKSSQNIWKKPIRNFTLPLWIFFEKGKSGKEDEKVGWIKNLFLLVILIVSIFFFLQNTEQVVIRFGLSPFADYQFFEISKVPLFLVILCSVLLGILIGGLGSLYRHFQLKRTIRQNQKAIERLEREIQSLRGPGLDQPSFLKKEG